MVAKTSNKTDPMVMVDKRFGVRKQNKTNSHKNFAQRPKKYDFQTKQK